MAARREHMIGSLVINQKVQGGFEESYALDTEDYAVGKTQLALIARYRAALLGGDHEIVHATVSRTGRRGDGARPAGLPFRPFALDGEVDPEASHTPESGFLYRFDTGTGKWKNFLIRGLRDTWIEEWKKTVAGAVYLDSFAPLPAVPTGTTTPANALLAFLKVVAATTFIMVPGDYQIQAPPAPTEPGYDVLPYTLVQFRRVSSRDVGPGYQRRSARRKRRV